LHFNETPVILIISGNERQNCFNEHISDSQIQYFLCVIKMTIDFSESFKSGP